MVGMHLAPQVGPPIPGGAGPEMHGGESGDGTVGGAPDERVRRQVVADVVEVALHLLQCRDEVDAVGDLGGPQAPQQARRVVPGRRPPVELLGQEPSMMSTSVALFIR